jgi:hypothetical protein
MPWGHWGHKLQSGLEVGVRGHKHTRSCRKSGHRRRGIPSLCDVIAQPTMALRRAPSHGCCNPDGHCKKAHGQNSRGLDCKQICAVARFWPPNSVMTRSRETSELDRARSNSLSVYSAGTVRNVCARQLKSPAAYAVRLPAYSAKWRVFSG